MNSFKQLFLANFKMFYREKEGFYWTVLLPAFIYIALSVLPIGQSFAGNLKYSNFVLPGIIAMTIMQGGVYSLSYWMVDLKSRGIIKRLLATPLKQWQLALSLVCARLVVMLAQTIILTLIGILVFKATFAGNIFSVLVLMFLGGSIFLLCGLLISSFAKTYDSAAPITSAIALPLTFLSNIFYPITLLPRSLKIVAEILPMNYLSDGLRQAYLQPFNLQIISKDVLVLFVWFVIILGFTLLTFRLKED
jgi:ABC-2 type transport system permease protein